MSQEFFWGCLLNQENKKYAWSPDVTKQLIAGIDVATLLVKQALIGSEVIDDEVNVIQVETEGIDSVLKKFPIARLSKGRSEQLYVDLFFSGKTKFRLVEGSGPVYLTGQLIIELREEIVPIDDGDDGGEGDEDSVDKGDEDSVDKGNDDASSNADSTISPNISRKRKATEVIGNSKKELQKMDDGMPKELKSMEFDSNVEEKCDPEVNAATAAEKGTKVIKKTAKPEKKVQDTNTKSSKKKDPETENVAMKSSEEADKSVASNPVVEKGETAEKKTAKTDKKPAKIVFAIKSTRKSSSK